MIAANGTGIEQLAGDIGGCFVAPIIVLCLGFANSKLPFNRRDSAFRMRLILAFAILLLVFSICTVLVQDRVLLVNLWRMSPVLYSFAYTVVGDLAPAKRIP